VFVTDDSCPAWVFLGLSVHAGNPFTKGIKLHPCVCRLCNIIHGNRVRTYRLMTRDDIRLLYEYDRWANRRLIIAAGTLNAEQFTRDLGGSFGSVRDTLLHILGGEWIWLAYWKDPPPSPAILSDLIARRDTLFHPDVFPNASVVQSKWMEIEKEQAEFVNRVTNEALERMIPFRGTHLKLMQLMQHLANHST